MIGVLDQNKEKLAAVTKEVGGTGGGIAGVARNVQEKIETAVATAKGEELSPEGKMLSEKFDQVLEKFDEVLENMTKSNIGKDAGTKDSVKGRR